MLTLAVASLCEAGFVALFTRRSSLDWVRVLYVWWVVAFAALLPWAAVFRYLSTVLYYRDYLAHLALGVVGCGAILATLKTRLLLALSRQSFLRTQRASRMRYVEAVLCSILGTVVVAIAAGAVWRFQFPR